MSPTILSLLSSLALALLPVGLPAAATSGQQPAEYPNKPIRFISGAAGSPPDVAARIVMERVAGSLRQPIVIDNRPGAIGTIGLHAVAKASPDGYTFGAFSLPHVLAPALLPQLPFDIRRDLSPVAQMTWSSHVLVVHAASRWRTVNDMVADAKSRPGQITFASGGNATPAHISGEFLKQRAGIDIRHIPYKGAIAGITAVLGDQAHLMFAATAASGPHIRSGRLRALATPAPQRTEDFPEVPTMIELGFAGFEVREWNGVVAPARTPREIVARMADEIVRATSESEIRARLVANGVAPADRSGPDDFGRLMRAELERWGAVVRAAGLRAD
jgi:tripartite-type tricarboxylate transporter receptor subunit TctC